MSLQDYSCLQELRPHSRKNIDKVARSRIQNRKEPRALVRHELVANGQFITRPKFDFTKPQGQSSIRVARELSQFGGHVILNELNTALQGGTNYPILTAGLGVVAGVVSFGAGLIFTVATTAISLHQTTSRVLARPGDKIIHVEEIGKERNGASYKPVYVSSFFLVDPFRTNGNSLTKGWLIHEEREYLSL